MPTRAARERDDDGILTAAEAAQLDLRGTQLVVLSACETGVGEVQNGEGVYGLRRALVLAGAQTQVASLWKVADAATKDLMVDYYRSLLKGEGRSAALRDVQRAMIAQPRALASVFLGSVCSDRQLGTAAGGALDRQATQMGRRPSAK